MSCDDDLVREFVVEANEHLADVENQFLSIEEAGDDVDVDLVNEVFRAIHSIKGAAGFLGLTKVNDLAHSLENLLNMMRNLELKPNSAIVDVMLRSADRLQSMINDIENSNDTDVSDFIRDLEAIANGELSLESAAEASRAVEADETRAAPAPAEAQAEPVAEIDPMDAAIEAAFNAKRAETAAQTNQEDAAAELKPVEAPAPIPTNSATASENKPAPSKKESSASPVDTSIRVSVGVLDKLMNLAGELVLSRNQLMQAIASKDRNGLDAIASSLDQVTSEVQESIMQTRMQQIGTVFGRFPRIVRDLGAKLGKQCNLEIVGKEVEVDKTIIEAIGDPLTHLIRNSMDHGIELPDVRQQRNKLAHGTMHLKACYQAGKVRLEIEDDGAGIDPQKLRDKAVSKGILTQEKADQTSDREAIRLIFHPGFSMAAQVTDVSGRGVGMDVVRTNISKLGGTVDVESVLGSGTKVVITLPLTLAIIPSLIVQSSSDRFAVPQVNIVELVRLRRKEMAKRVGRVQDAEVLRLRGKLLPLIRLRDVIGTSEESSAPCDEDEEVEQNEETHAINILVVDTGQQSFGLIVDALHDSEEIVVKPLGRHLKGCPCLSGATILGDGHVALILDVAGIASHESIRHSEELNEEEQKKKATKKFDNQQEVQHLLLFSNNSEEHFAVSMDVISRIDRIRADQIDSVGGQELLQYRNTTMSLLRLENCITARRADEKERLYVIVFEVSGKEVGLVAPHLEDIRKVTTLIDMVTFRERGVLGSMVVGENTTRLVDLFELANIAHPEWREEQNMQVQVEDGSVPMILLAEDSTFFRKQVSEMVREQGYSVIDCEDGLIAWEMLSQGGHEFDAIVTDIEMPNMNGFEFADRVKQSPAFKHIPVIALTSLAGSADVQRGIEVGIDDYQIKMDRDKLLNSLRNFTGGRAGSNKPALESV